MTAYVILIREPGWDAEQTASADWDAMWAQHHAFTAAVTAAGGTVVDGEALEGPGSGFRIDPSEAGEDRFGPIVLSDIRRLVTGYYKIELPDGADVREIAALCPTDGSLEVYPVMVLPEG